MSSATSAPGQGSQAHQIAAASTGPLKQKEWDAFLNIAATTFTDDMAADPGAALAGLAAIMDHSSRVHRAQNSIPEAQGLE